MRLAIEGLPTRLPQVAQRRPCGDTRVLTLAQTVRAAGHLTPTREPDAIAEERRPVADRILHDAIRQPADDLDFSAVVLGVLKLPVLRDRDLAELEVRV